MNLFRKIALLGVLLFLNNTSAQNSNQELVKINHQSFSVATFERMYTKNQVLLENNKEHSIDDNLQLFIALQIKLQKARALKLDTLKEYSKEVALQRKDLAKKYLTDQSKMDALIKEAYQRYLVQKRATHLLLKLDENASSADTLKVFNKAMDIYNEIQNGLDFNQAALKYSEDPSVKSNNGDVGFFGVFTMVYPFETAVYKTPLGKVSKPFRTEYGYHLVKITGQRPSRTSRDLSLISISFTPETEILAHDKIKKAYKKLLQGTSFENVAENFSDQPLNSKIKGFHFGFSKSKNFDDEIQKITAVNQITKPFKDKNSWIVAKVDAIEPLSSFEKQLPSLRRKIKTDRRAQILEKDLFDFLKKKYSYQEESKNMESFKKQLLQENKIIDSLSENLKSKKMILARFENQKITSEDFFKNLSAKVQITKNNFDKLYKNFARKTMKNYYDKHLEDYFPEFKNLVQEYSEGLLLFTLLEKEIFPKANLDTLGAKAYFKSQVNQYRSAPKFEGFIVKYASDKEAQKAKVFYQKKNSLQDLLKKNPPLYWQKGRFNWATITSSTFDILPNLPKVFSNDSHEFILVVAKEIFPEKQLLWEEVKTEIFSKYQEVYYKQWTNNLLKEAKVVINTAALEQLKQKYQAK